MAAVFSDRLSEVFVEVADTLVEDFDLIEFLQTGHLPHRGAVRRPCSRPPPRRQRRPLAADGRLG